MQFFRKNKFFFDLIAFVVFAFASYMFFDEYFEEKKKMQLVTAITSGLMAIFKLEDLINRKESDKV